MNIASRYIVTRTGLLTLLICLICNQTVNAKNSAIPTVTVQVAALNDGTYEGVSADVSMPNTASLTSNSNEFVAAPIALTNSQAGSSLFFIEAGPIKNCNVGYDCMLRPYAAKQTGATGTYNLFVDPTRLLANNGNYGYRVERTSSTNFQGVFCDAFGCGLLREHDMGLNNFPGVFTAGESSGTRWGTITIRTARTKNAGASSWNDWCYTIKSSTVSGGYVTPCFNYGWLINYGYLVYVPLVYVPFAVR
jgi:hypothetical protein